MRLCNFRLASEEPPKGYTDNRIDDKHNIRTRKYDTRMCVKSNPVIKEVPPTEHDSVARHDGYQRPHTREPHELGKLNALYQPSSLISQVGTYS